MVFSTVSQQKNHLLANSFSEKYELSVAIFIILWYCVLLPGGATHENITQESVRLLLYPARVFGAEAGSGRMPPGTD